MTHRIRLIGVSGQLGAGKDTVSDYLCSAYGFSRVALADPIKRLGYYVFLFSDKQLWGPSQLRNSVDSRFLSSEMWDSTEARLRAYSVEFCTSVIGTDDPHVISNAVNALFSWFVDLKREYRTKLSPRVMLQTLGTEWGRHCVSDDVWISHLLKVSRCLLNEDGNTNSWEYNPLSGPSPSNNPTCGVVVSDVRFANELSLIKDAGGSLIRVIRPETDSLASSVGVSNHESEQLEMSMASFDFILNNEGSLTDLYNAVDMFMRVLHK